VGDEDRRKAERKAREERDLGGEDELAKMRAKARVARLEGGRHAWLAGKLVVIDGVRTSYVGVLEVVREWPDSVSVILTDPYALESLADRNNQVAIGKAGDDGVRRFEIYAHAILGIGECHF
jgi:hypothetical protein